MNNPHRKEEQIFPTGIEKNIPVAALKQKRLCYRKNTAG